MVRIHLDGASRAYADGFTLAPTTLDFASRSLSVILGPSGSGKSTLLRLIAGLEFPEAGRVLLDGADQRDVSPEARRVGLVFQDGALFPHLDVAGNVGFALRAQRLSRASREERVTELLALVDMRAFGPRRVTTLSGGERQRVALARALAARPRALLLDEPLASLDRNLREELRGVIRRLHDELELTTILVTHDREEALALADRLVLMRAGRVVEEGAPEEMFRAPRTAFAARFLGAANLIGNVLVAPDAVTLREGGEARVIAHRFAGFHEEARVRLPDGTEVEVRGPLGSLPAKGAAVTVSWDPARARTLSDASASGDG
jgi:ABC-type Fe3+/spermidine/putrescine transport system ATPase subunit